MLGGGSAYDVVVPKGVLERQIAGFSKNATASAYIVLIVRSIGECFQSLPRSNRYRCELMFGAEVVDVSRQVRYWVMVDARQIQSDLVLSLENMESGMMLAVIFGCTKRMIPGRAYVVARPSITQT